MMRKHPELTSFMKRSFYRWLYFINYSRNVLPFLEPESSLQCSQMLATGPCQTIQSPASQFISLRSILQYSTYDSSSKRCLHFRFSHQNSACISIPCVPSIRLPLKSLIPSRCVIYKICVSESKMQFHSI